jgi:hypothetical protein
MGLFDEKTEGRKSHDTVPLRCLSAMPHSAKQKPRILTKWSSTMPHSAGALPAESGQNFRSFYFFKTTLL